jgi:hypothetical protein
MEIIVNYEFSIYTGKQITPFISYSYSSIGKPNLYFYISNIH